MRNTLNNVLTDTNSRFANIYISERNSLIDRVKGQEHEYNRDM